MPTPPIQCVREEDIAWHARGGNANSIGIELAGFAAQRRSAGTTPTAVPCIDRAARLTADVCERYRPRFAACVRPTWSRAGAASAVTWT